MSPITTHVLDISIGRPAVFTPCQTFRQNS